MLLDVDYLQSRLGKMEGFEGVGEYLVDIIKSKEVKFAPPKPEPMSSLLAAQVGCPPGGGEAGGVSDGKGKVVEGNGDGNGNGNRDGDGEAKAEGESGNGGGEA